MATLKPVNMKTASKEELMTVNGIREVDAEKIIRYRNSVDPDYVLDICDIVLECDFSVRYAASLANHGFITFASPTSDHVTANHLVMNKPVNCHLQLETSYSSEHEDVVCSSAVDGKGFVPEPPDSKTATAAASGVVAAPALTLPYDTPKTAAPVSSVTESSLVDHHLCDPFDNAYEDVPADVKWRTDVRIAENMHKQQKQLTKLRQMYTSCQAELLYVKPKLSECQAILADTTLSKEQLAEEVSKLRADLDGSVSMLRQSRDVMVNMHTRYTSAEQQLCEEKLKNSTLEASVASLNTQLKFVSCQLDDAEQKNQTLFTENKALHTQVSLMQKDIACMKKDLEETEARSVETERLKLELIKTQESKLSLETWIATLCQQLADSEAFCHQVTSDLAKCKADNDKLKQDMSWLEQPDLELDSLISTLELSLTQRSSHCTLSSSSSPAAFLRNDTKTSPISFAELMSSTSQNCTSQPCINVNANLGSGLEDIVTAVEPLEPPANQDGTCSGSPTVTSRDGIEDCDCSFIPANGGVHTIDVIRFSMCVDGNVASTVSNKQLLVSPSCRSATISPDSLRCDNTYYHVESYTTDHSYDTNSKPEAGNETVRASQEHLNS